MQLILNVKIHIYCDTVRSLARIWIFIDSVTRFVSGSRSVSETKLSFFV
jgi:hypothetical protein